MKNRSKKAVRIVVLFILTVVFGLLFGGGLVISAFKVKERIQPTTPKEKFDFKQFIKMNSVSITAPDKGNLNLFHFYTCVRTHSFLQQHIMLRLKYNIQPFKLQGHFEKALSAKKQKERFS